MKQLLRIRLHPWVILLSLTLSSFSAQSQGELAALSSSSPASAKQGGQQMALRDVLLTLEKTHTIRFYYDSELLQDVFVSEKALGDASEVEQLLNKLLPALRLQYEKIGKNAYAIQPSVRTKGVKRLRKNALKSAIPSYQAPEQLAAANNRTPRPNSVAKTITGRVTDGADNSPLPGVNILVKETSVGTVTDVEGNYRLTAPDEATTLVFSSIGYQTQEVAINGQSTVNVALAADVQSLSEVVVVGYGSQKKSDLTGSVSSVSAQEVAEFPLQRVDQALQGRAPGVYVQNLDGSPGGETIIRIRGLNSINGDNKPLIVIDGFQGGNLDNLNPNDIASIEILKDASATAIYGSRGANGVILVTTKLGAVGTPKISYDYNIGFQTLNNKLDLMNAGEFARLVNADALTQTGGGATATPIFTEEEIAEFDRTGGTDWQDVIYGTGVIQNHQLSISGGTEKLQYLVSGGFLDHEGIMKNSSYLRGSLRTNLRAELTEWLNFGINGVITREETSSPPFREEVSFVGQAVNVTPRWAPTEPVLDEFGNYAKHRAGYGADDTWNPLASAVEPQTQQPTNIYNANLFLEFELAKGLQFKTTGGALVNNDIYRSYYNRLTFDGLANNGLGNLRESQNVLYQNSNILTYTRQFAERHELTVTAVAEQQFERFESSEIEASEFLNDVTGIDDLGGAANSVVNSDRYTRSLASFLGRINYSFDDKYLLTASYRADGSSVFGSNNKWGYFPSASVAWRVSEEEFLKGTVVSNLKLRASYGITGNQAIDPYQTLASISSGRNYPYDGSETTEIGFYIASLANDNLKWERTTQTNLGLDVEFFEGRLGATLDLYQKTTDDLLLGRELPGYVGVDFVIDNVGSVENRGIELLLRGTPVAGDFTWNTSVNFTVNRNEVLDLGDDDRIPFTTTTGGYSLNEFMFLVEGEPFGQMIGWGYEGTWNTDEAEEAARYGQLPGDPRYTDVNDDGAIDIDDKIVIGNAFPDYQIGWNNTLSYKNVELSFLIQTSQGNDLFNTPRIRLENPNEGTSRALLDRWTPDNQDTDVPAFIDQRTREDANLVNTVSLSGNETSRWVEDASYIRLRSITLAYNLPASWLNRVGISNLRVYTSGTNLFTITDYTGYDPEVGSFGTNDASLGVDFSTYPSSKTFTFGAQVTF